MKNQMQIAINARMLRASDSRVCGVKFDIQPRKPKLFLYSAVDFERLKRDSIKAAGINFNKFKFVPQYR